MEEINHQEPYIYVFLSSGISYIKERFRHVELGKVKFFHNFNFHDFGLFKQNVRVEFSSYWVELFGKNTSLIYWLQIFWKNLFFIAVLKVLWQRWQIELKYNFNNRWFISVLMNIHYERVLKSALIWLNNQLNSH